ncbi:glycosyltransferase [Altererythrobacter sp. H2]|uniref:glycosyltransferase n=1 Tax=Altererythrobacter sp. H2 TaxID=3108391 RepID=UPI002B4BE361|nr:glycosyltransferase [Altererythrobacter sp. H2]WRK95078.1 glycosyltransferase [Altererythrobacter sp. H2]
MARSMEALAAQGDWQVTMINPIGVPPLAFGRYRALRRAAMGGVEQGVEVHRPTFTLIPRLGARINPGVIARTILPLVTRLHRDQPFDLVDAQFFYPDGPVAARIAEKLGLPFSVKARGSDITYWGGRGFAAEQMVDAARRATGLLAVSQALAEDMAALGMDRNKITIHYTGLDRERFRPLGHAGLRTRLNDTLGLSLPETRPVLATVGALLELKGQHLVIGALPALPGMHLMLVGKGENERQLRDLAAKLGLTDRVHFLGSIDHDMLPLVLSAADAMVLPTRNEGLANAWVESLACGTPVVTCGVGGAGELVTEPAAGELVERSIPAIVAGIRAVLAREAPREDVAATVDRFDWRIHSAELAAYYDRLVAQVS